MIVGLGIDLVPIDRFIEKEGIEAFLHKVFTPAELSSCRAVKNASERFAGKFAAKEAFMKAIGHGIRQEVWFSQIEVLNHETGEPFIRVSGEAQHLLKECGAEQVLVSISHTRDLAIAMVILEK